MPYEPTTPAQAPVTVKTSEQKAIDRFHIDELTINLVPSSPRLTTIRVRWQEGYDDEGTFRPVNRRQAKIKGPNLVTELSATCNSDNTRFDEIKQALWTLLKLEGLIDAGTVS